MKKGTTTIVLNGQEYKISFNFGVMKAVCKETGLTMPQVINGIQNMDLEVIGAIVAQGILFNDKDFDKEIIEQLDLLEIFEAFQTIGELLTESMPKADAKKKAVAKKK